MRTVKLTTILVGVGLVGAGVLGCLGSTIARAAPPVGQYCVVGPGLVPNCRFVDEESCARAAAAAGAGCIDRNGFGTSTSGSPRNAGYCLVQGGDAKCNFFDAASCAKAAQTDGGTCITRPKLSSPTS
jgi:hypothetical protein